MQAAPTSIAPAPGGAERVGDERGRVRGQLVLGHRRHEHEVDVGGRHSGGLQRPRTRLRGVIGQALVGARAAALPHARARHDPLLADPELLGELGRGQPALGQRGGHREDRGATQQAVAGVGDQRRRRPGSAVATLTRAQAWTSSTSDSVRLARPVSTRPGPTSTKRSTPRSCRASSVSRQRTGMVRAAASWARTSSKGSAVTALSTVAVAGGHLARVQRGPEGGHGLGHHRRVKGAGDRQLAGPQPERLGRLGGGRDGRALAGQHDLLGRVVVGHRRARGARASSGACSAAPAPIRASMPPVAGALAGLLHEAPAQGDELQAVALGQAPGGDERAELAERVAGHELAAADARAPPSRRGWRRRWPAGRNWCRPRARGNGSSPTTEMACSSRSGRRCGDEIAHLGRLAALTGEEDCRGSHTFEPTSHCGVRYTVTADFPPFGGLLADSDVLQFDAEPMSLPEPRPDAAALVTGASAGIGGAIAHELARRGHDLILVARRKRSPRGARRTSSTTPTGVHADVLPCDLGDAAARGRLPAQVAELGLEVDVLINNAGFATSGPFDQSDPDRELEQVRVLVEAVMALTRAFVPGMVARHRGAILNVASTAGMQPLPYNAGYSAAKAYVLTFSEALHQELRGKGITVTVLCPGPVKTDFWDIAGWEVKGGKSLDSAVGPAAISPAQAASAGIKGLEPATASSFPACPCARR